MTDEQPEMSYEDARTKLDEVVRQLESGSTSLTDSMKLWQEGERLAKICQTWLDGAKQQVEQARRADTSAELAEVPDEDD